MEINEFREEFLAQTHESAITFGNTDEDQFVADTLDLLEKNEEVLTPIQYSCDMRGSQNRNIGFDAYAYSEADSSIVLIISDFEIENISANLTNTDIDALYKKMRYFIEDAYNNHEVLTAKVVQVLNGGLSVTVEEARVFIPASLVSDSYERDLTKYADQEIEFVITEFNPRRRRIIGDRKQLMVARKAEMQKELFERIKPGDIVDGVVKLISVLSSTSAALTACSTSPR